LSHVLSLPDTPPTGLSFKTQALYATVFVARYLDLLYRWVSLYNFFMKIFFIASSVYILFLMKMKYRSVVSLFPLLNSPLINPPPPSLPQPSRPTHDPSIDTFRIEYLIGPCVVLSLIFNYGYNVTEILWSFSIFLEWCVSLLSPFFPSSSPFVLPPYPPTLPTETETNPSIA
jgi:ER lumen protein retaining receptor